jgi:hypothetical protein
VRPAKIGLNFEIPPRFRRTGTRGGWSACAVRDCVAWFGYLAGLLRYWALRKGGRLGYWATTRTGPGKHTCV